MTNMVYPKTFMWLFVGLAITFLTGFYVSINSNMLYNVVNNWYILILIEFGIVIYLGARITKMKYVTAMISYLLYSFVTGLTFAAIFVVFAISSIINIFAVAAVLFLIFAAIGYFAKIDLTKWGSMLLMALIGLIIMILVNLFLNNSTFDLVISCVGVLIFVIYTAYDIQKIKQLEEYIDEDKLPIYGAFQLYLDFINIFIYLLRIFGKARD